MALGSRARLTKLIGIWSSLLSLCHDAAQILSDLLERLHYVFGIISLPVDGLTRSFMCSA